MKRILAVVALVAMFVMMFAACGGGGKVGTCDLCSTENVNVRDITVEGDTGWFCDNCYDTAKSLAELASQMGGL